MAFWACGGASSVGSCNICGDEPVFALLKFAFFVFFHHFCCCFFSWRFEHGRFSCKGGREMTNIIPTVFATSCSRPTALWASQPSLVSCSHLSSFVLHCSYFLIISPISPLFTLFPLPFFSLFSTVCQQLSFTFSHFPLFPVFFGQSDASPCDHLLTEMTGSHKRTRLVVKEDFACFSAFLAHSKKGPNYVKSQKKERF